MIKDDLVLLWICIESTLSKVRRSFTIKSMDHSLLGTRRERWSQIEREIEKTDRDGRRRTRARAIEHAKEEESSFHENSCRSFEAFSLVRASHLAESESPGRPCNDAQVHAEQDPLFASPSSSPSFSLPFHLLPPPPSPPLPPPSSSSSEQWHGRAEHLLLCRCRASLGFSPHRAAPLKHRKAEDSS